MMIDQHKVNSSPKEVLDLSILDIVLFIKKYYLPIIVICTISGIIGIVYSYTLPKLYKSQTILLPEYSMSNNSSFFSLAIGTSQGAENLVPDLYPDILKSAPFGLFLLKQQVVNRDNIQYNSLEDYIEKTTKPSFFPNFFGKKNNAVPKHITPDLLLKKNILDLSQGKINQINGATSFVNTVVEKKKGIITIESEINDPFVAALLVEAAKDYLINYVEDYRTYKASRYVTFLEQRMNDARKWQRDAEYALQSYRDRNRNSFTNVAKIEEMRLQSDFTLASSQYSSIASSLEQARLKLKEEKPVFKVLEPTKISLDKSSPKRLQTGLTAAIFSGFIGLIYILLFKEKIYKKFI